MSKKTKLLFFWEPFSLSAELFDETGQILNSYSILLPEGKSAQEGFEELTSDIEIKHVKETSLLIRQTGVKLQQYTIPKLKESERLHFIQSKIHKDWEDESKFLWSHIELKSSSNNKHSVQTFVLEREFIDAFIAFSKSINALPLRAFTTQALAMYTAIISSDPRDDSIVLYDNENSVLLVMVEKGKPVLLREMPYSAILDRNEEFQRLSKEIQRTWLYAKQQYKFFPTKVLFSGDELYSEKDTLSNLIDEVTLEKDLKQDWKLSIFHSSVVDPANLIPKDIQHTKRTLRLVSFWSIIFLALFCISGFWNLFNRAELFGLNDKIKSESIIEKTSDFEKQINKYQIRKDSIRFFEEQQVLVKSYSNQPIPAFLLMYLSENIPDNLILTRFQITRDSIPSKWNLTLAGRSPRDPIQSAQVLKSFSEQTKSDLKKLNLIIDWKEPWLQNLKSGRSNEPDQNIKPFELKGVLFE